MNSPPTPADRIRPKAARFGLLALVLLGAGAGLTWQAIHSLPQMQTARIKGDELSTAFRAAYQRAPASASAGIRLMESSGDVTAALMRVRPVDDCARRCAARAQQTTNTQLPRLQQTSLLLLALERMNTPIEQQWTAIEPYVGGLGDVSFAHFHRDALDALSGAVVSVGCTPGVAGDIVHMRYGTPHGPFLQYFTARMFSLAAALDQLEGHHAAASQCRAVGLRLLKQWIIEPGPAGLRLQAADLLIRALLSQQDVATPTTTKTATTADVSTAATINATNPQTARIAAELGQWANAYRRELRKRPTAQFDLRRQPALAPREFTRSRNSLAMLAWTGGAAALSGLLILGLFWTAFGARTLDRDGLQRAKILGAAGGGFVVLSGFAILIRGDSLLADMSWAWMRLPLYSAGMTLVIAGLAAFLTGARRDVPATETPTRRPASQAMGDRLLPLFCGISVAGTMLSVAFAIIAWMAGASLHAYDQAVAMALRDEIQAVSPGSAETYLSTLRAWTP